MKATWQGYITLGQLGLPVRLYSASQSIRPHFTQLHDKDGSPVERVLRCQEEDRPISSSELVRAIEHEGRFITFTNQEIERAAASAIRTIDVKQFCAPDAIESIYYEKPYYIVPSKGGERAYALLREALVRSGKLAVAQLVMYGREHIAAIGVNEDILVLNQLRFAAEIVPRASIKTRPLPKPNPAEVATLQAVVNRFSGPFYIGDYHDEYAEQLQLLFDRKAKGLPMPREERPAPHATPEDEIIAALNTTLGSKQQLATGEE